VSAQPCRLDHPALVRRLHGVLFASLGIGQQRGGFAYVSALDHHMMSSLQSLAQCKATANKACEATPLIVLFVFSAHFRRAST
jgi:hypothetical protein